MGWNRSLKHAPRTIAFAGIWGTFNQWQAIEREVDGHIARGEETTYKNSEEFLAPLDRLTGEDDSK